MLLLRQHLHQTQDCDLYLVVDIRLIKMLGIRCIRILVGICLIDIHTIAACIFVVQLEAVGQV